MFKATRFNIAVAGDYTSSSWKSVCALCTGEKFLCKNVMYDKFFLKLLAVVYLVYLKALAILKLTVTSLVFYQLFTGGSRVLLVFVDLFP